MKQILQNFRDGTIEVADVPAPTPRPGYVLIRSVRSLVSPGTERSLLDFGRANLVQKALQQPDRVRQVLDKVRSDGLLTTVEAVRSKLDQPTHLGYCNVGRVLDPCTVEGLQVGDRVVSNGPHSEIVRVPKNLVMRIPDLVDDDSAAFTVLGAIALEGVRLAKAELGESVAVIGLGLVGLMAVQLLRAQGARVLGIDPDASRCELARQAGAEICRVAEGSDPVAAALDFSRGRGMDAVLICAATKSNAPIEQSAQMARTRGRVVLVGVVGLNVPRDEFYRKELTFQVSCSYGPGRYDPAYEDLGQDYPIGYVRWTAQRNFEAVLDMMAQGRLDLRAYITRRASIASASEVYASLDGALGILFDYPNEQEVSRATQIQLPAASAQPRDAKPGKRLGIVGAGNYASRILVPAFKKAGADLVVVCGSGTASEVHVARSFGFSRASSRAGEVLAAPDVDVVAIATRHDSHAQLVTQALDAGKAVFVEKPLALTDEEIDAIEAAYRRASHPFLMVGYNRRFSPFVVALKGALAHSPAPAAIVITVNAGAIPADHWTQNRQVGGGRIIGEACHFVDLARHLAGAPMRDMHAQRLGTSASIGPIDSAALTLGFENGALASIQYLANGHRTLPKERIEVFCGGRVWRIDNFQRMTGFGAAGLRGSVLGAQDKGQEAMAKSVLDAVAAGQPSPIPFGEVIEVARAMLALDRALDA